MTRCAVCHARVDINAAPEHPQHIWHLHGDPRPLCHPCFRAEALKQWPDPSEVPQ